MQRLLLGASTVAFLALPLSNAAFAQSPRILQEDATRYMALGDSIAAGFKAMPVNDGYTYRLYQEGAFDAVPHTLFTNAAVPGATSGDVLRHQVPQALIPFAEGGLNPGYITLTVGGNDLLAILRYIATHQDPLDVQQFATTVLTAYGQNLTAAIFQLRQGLPNARNLLLVERHGAAAFETHPTSVGYRVMADAFAEMIAANK